MADAGRTIFEYDNYRLFLKDFYARSKSTDKKFSFRYFSKLVGYTSPNFLKCVIDGKRNLTSDGIKRFARALKLNGEEALFFENLVYFNQSKTEEERRRYAGEILRCRAYKKLFPLKEAQFKYFANWFLIPIRELVGLPDFREDPDWIAQCLIPPITSVRAKQALEELLKLGLITRDENGRLVQTNADVTTPDEILSAFKADCLIELIRLGAESIKRISREKRDISSVTIGLSPAALETVKEMAQKFRRDVMEVANRTHPTSDNVYQFNIQFFPLTDIKSSEDK